MSVSQETLDMIKAAIKNGANAQGTLVRSKLTNRLLWCAGENDENDPYGQYLSMIGGASASVVERKQLMHAGGNCEAGGERMVLGQIHPQQKQHAGLGLKAVYEEQNGSKNGRKHENENQWRDQWEILKKAGKYCSLCKNNKEGREIYLSHNLKGPNGEVTCPILLECDCSYCGKRGHTIAYCPDNQTGTSILKMMNRHNRI